jgi:CBS domain-containing protein
MAQRFTAEQYMSSDLVTFSPAMDLRCAIRLLLKNRISGAPVVDSLGRLVGILTKKDCLKVAFSASYHQEWGGAVPQQPVPAVPCDEEWSSRGGDQPPRRLTGARRPLVTP